MIRKLVKLIKNYDKIMMVIEEYEKSSVKVKKVEPKKTNKKSYSLVNTPIDQKEYIDKIMKGEL